MILFLMMAKSDRMRYIIQKDYVPGDIRGRSLMILLDTRENTAILLTSVEPE